MSPARIAGAPPWALGAGALALIGGIWYIKRKQAAPATSTVSGGQPPFTQAQQIQDYQIFSQLTSAQQSSDLSLVGQMLSLFGGGASNGTPKGLPTGTGATGNPLPAGGGSGIGGGGGGTSPPAPTASTSPNLPTQTFGGRSWEQIGYLNSTGHYAGYGVSGGAPVGATWAGQGTPSRGIGFTIHGNGTNESIWTPVGSSLTGYVATQLGA